MCETHMFGSIWGHHTHVWLCMCVAWVWYVCDMCVIFSSIHMRVALYICLCVYIPCLGGSALRRNICVALYIHVCGCIWGCHTHITHTSHTHHTHITHTSHTYHTHVLIYSIHTYLPLSQEHTCILNMILSTYSRLSCHSFPTIYIHVAHMFLSYT